MTLPYFTSANLDAYLLRLVPRDQFDSFIGKLEKPDQAWVKKLDLKPEGGTFVFLPKTPESIVIAVIDPEDAFTSWAKLAMTLPAATYRLDDQWLPYGTSVMQPLSLQKGLLGWALAQYQFSRYLTRSEPLQKRILLWPEGVNQAYLERVIPTIFWVRDMVNTPALDMGPAELADEAQKLAREFQASCQVIVGDDLLKENFPLVYAVGKASTNEPRLIDIKWGKPDHPKVVLVGKGVCFDTGGLDLKTSCGMLTMKKDMGGAAHALGLARLIMTSDLPLNVRVIIPAVENSVAGNANRPLDIIKSRAGLTVEIGNTDAEGRMILADALALACEDNPDIIVDFATLTGAARIALGPALPALFGTADDWIGDLLKWSVQLDEPVWHMPLFKPYRALYKSPMADMNNISQSGFAGAIIAALFLQEFVKPDTAWLHLDLYAANATSTPGRPEGGEAMALQALLHTLEDRLCK